MRARTLRSRLDRLARAQPGRALRIWDASPLSHVETAHVQALLDIRSAARRTRANCRRFSRGALQAASGKPSGSVGAAAAGRSVALCRGHEAVIPASLPHASQSASTARATRKPPPRYRRRIDGVILFVDSRVTRGRSVRLASNVIVAWPGGAAAGEPST